MLIKLFVNKDDAFLLNAEEGTAAPFPTETLKQDLRYQEMKGLLTIGFQDVITFDVMHKLIGKTVQGILESGEFDDIELLEEIK